MGAERLFGVVQLISTIHACVEREVSPGDVSDPRGRKSLVAEYHRVVSVAVRQGHVRLSAMRERACPICGVKLHGETALAAFCSERCRLIDLGNWVGERYRVPDEDRPGDDEPPEEWPS